MDSLDDVIETIRTKRFDEYYLFIKQILLLSTTILGLLITLRKDTIINANEKYAFIITLGTLGLCILNGTILLYGKIRALDNLHQLLMDEKLLHTHGIHTGNDKVYAKTDVLFSVLQTTYFVLFSIAICSLVAYGILAYA